eukprot:Gb_31908 [translate_table: standard]
MRRWQLTIGLQRLIHCGKQLQWDKPLAACNVTSDATLNWDLIKKSPEQSDFEKKIYLLKYILKTRQLMLCLRVLIEWCSQIPLVQYCQQLNGTLTSHDMCLHKLLASHVLFLRQLRSHHISVSASEWDYQMDRFLPPRNWSIKVSGNLRLLVADIMADYETGELKPYLVLGSYWTLVIGFIDISGDKFTVVAEIPITSNFIDNDSSAELECLLSWQRYLLFTLIRLKKSIVVTKMIAIMSKLDRQHPERFPDIIIGTYDCKILECSTTPTTHATMVESSLLRYKKKGIVYVVQFHPEKSETLSLVENHSSKHASTLAKRVIACLNVRRNDKGDLVVTKGDQYDVREPSEKCMKPDHVTSARVARACAYPEALKQGKEIHGHAIKTGFDSNVSIGNTLVSMYANANNIEDACKIFEKLPKRDVVLWTTMIVSCASHDHAKESLQLFKEMQSASIKPDHICFLGVSSTWLIFLVELDTWMRQRI